jgi:alkylhydroperoxidase family enzyme
MTANYERAFSDRAEVYAAWVELNTSIKSGMDLRRYELVTLAAARRLRSSYCCLAHGKILFQQFEEPVREIALDHRAAGLDQVDVAVMDFAEKVVDDACAITEQDHDELRALGLTDKDILDVTLAATARCFFSKTLDAMRIQPDAHFRDLDDELREALEVGRPIAEA